MHTLTTLFTTAFSWEVAVDFREVHCSSGPLRPFWYLWLNDIQCEISNHIQSRSIKTTHIQHASIIWVCDGKTI
ncbi:hypothetical protein I79_014647 [Cricetulus griseus]|uniref:Uncharacterized protein n=1 Tax=Cricetulus griseus TaxID=10029 RepID=G3HUN4_CRIGR|nr:hypothetical protein I79_014647 [Cricetulus griseus]